MTEAAVELRGVRRSFGGREALAGIDLRLERGEAVGYLGPNGAGKTTTLKLLVGFLRPSAGDVRVFGIDPTRPGSAALARLGALLETPGLVPYVRGRDWLAYVAAVRGVSPPERGEAVESAARATGVAGELDRPLGELSTGVARRLLIAGALVGDPELLILDEPTLGLDPAARTDLRRLLRELRTEGRTILLSTHLLDDVEAVCDRVIFLRDGRIVGDEPVRRDTEAAGLRTVRLRGIAPVPWERWAATLGSDVALEALDPAAAELRFRGDDLRQAELLEALRAGGLRLVAAEPQGGSLAARYLERVGREDAA